MTHVSIIAVPRALGSGIAIPLEMLSAANDVARARGRRGRLIRIDVAGAEEGAATLAGGLAIRCRRTLDTIRATDLAFVPAVWRRPGRALADHPRIAGWLKRRHAGAPPCAPWSPALSSSPRPACWTASRPRPTGAISTSSSGPIRG